MATLRLSHHARERINGRLQAIVTAEEIKQAIQRKIIRINEIGGKDVNVVIKRFSKRVYVWEDGTATVEPDNFGPKYISSGEYLIACIDCETAKVKTVRLARQSQVERKSNLI